MSIALITSSLLTPFLSAGPTELPPASPWHGLEASSPADALLVPDPQGAPAPRQRARWARGQTVMQGFFGVTEFDDFAVDGGSFGQIDGGGEDAAELPLLGGGAQTKLGGDKIDFGLEGIFSMGWRSNATAFAIGGGGAAIAVDVDTFLLELYGGPFANMFLGEVGRVYASVGPLVEWADYDQEIGGAHDSGSGFGFGFYARTGIEFAIGRRTMLGVGTRWSDSTIDLDGGLGDLEMQGFQFLVTVTQGF
jgi:hypothetical protein